jgi:hypothetical protein
MLIGRITIEIIDDNEDAYVRLPDVVSFESTDIYSELVNIVNWDIEELREEMR